VVGTTGASTGPATGAIGSIPTWVGSSSGTGKPIAFKDNERTIPKTREKRIFKYLLGSV
jgi:hypothetical protein